MNVTISNCLFSIPCYNDTRNISTSSTITFMQFSGFKVTAENMSLAIALILLVIVTILGNLLVLLSFIIEPRLRQPFNMYIFNLAITDFLVAVTAMTFYSIDTILGYWPFGTVMCGVWIYFDFALTFSSVFTIVAISIDRWWSVTWPNQYRLHNTPLKTLIILLVGWSCVLAIWTPPFLFDRLRHQEPDICIWLPSENRQFVIFVAVIGHYIPCAVMVFCYIKVFMVMRRKAKISHLGNIRTTKSFNTGDPSPGTSKLSVPKLHFMIESHCKPMSLEDGYRHDIFVSSTAFVVAVSCGIFGGTKEPIFRVINHSLVVEATTNKRKGNGSSINAASSSTRSTLTSTTDSQTRERRMFRTLTCILTGYLICWFPFYVIFDTYAWRPELVPGWLYTLFFWTSYFNSTLNPLIYAYTSNKFRRTFRRMLTCKWCDQYN
ncbi:hypothetical protein CHS0354_027080 [Potamilus streckersoni]|uniref:G-protein coupled receptors family 1 profile domain-containing protein n=1 Tax=Potamilus streckersoni TaxID=2493646 RepID=A0AAE0S091_9BIVA|nr:hypothetical protein CHS0354_027080 [Potamilus streckersoni]